MAENKQPRYRRANQLGSARSFDVIAPTPSKKSKKPKRAANFPAVGMTLSTYNAPGAAAGRRRAATFQSAPKGSARAKQHRRVFTRKRVILAVVAILLLVFGWLGFKFAYNIHKLFGGSVFDVLSTGQLDGESSGRVNILLAGNSADDPGHQGGALTDSIMILSIDTKNHTGFMLSIPRDLYVKIPDEGHAKINEAYPDGQADKFSESGYPSGGMGLLEKTVKQTLGVNCQYYALVNYNALRDAVNSVGGVDVTIKSTDHRGLYDPSKDWATGGPLVRLTNGTHHLSGEQALDLARARGDAYGSYGFANSDFDRTAHQQQIILALRSKATTAGVLANPIRLSKLFDSIGSNVQTDLTLSNVRRLYQITKDIGGNNIQSVSLNNADGENLLGNYRTHSGASALIPAAGLDDFSDIRTFIQRLTSSNLVVREGADVVLLNGTTTSGLAARQSDMLETQNIDVSDVADAATDDHTTTQIIDASKGTKPATLKALKKAFNGSTVITDTTYTKAYPKADFIVILGTDRVANTSTANGSSSAAN